MISQWLSQSIKGILYYSKKLGNHTEIIKYFICHHDKHLALLI